MEKTEIDKLAKLAQNDRKKINQLLKTIYPPLFIFLKKRAKTTADAEDILQETLISINQSLPLWTGRGHFISFCYAISRHELADFYLKEKIYQAKKAVVTKLKTLFPPNLADLLEKKLLIQSLLQHLPRRYRLVLILKYSYGLSIKEIAIKLGASSKGVESLLFRAREKGKKILLGPNG